MLVSIWLLCVLLLSFIFFFLWVECFILSTCLFLNLQVECFFTTLTEKVYFFSFCNTKLFLLTNFLILMRTFRFHVVLQIVVYIAFFFIIVIYWWWTAPLDISTAWDSIAALCSFTIVDAFQPHKIFFFELFEVTFLLIGCRKQIQIVWSVVLPIIAFGPSFMGSDVLGSAHLAGIKDGEHVHAVHPVMYKKSAVTGDIYHARGSSARYLAWKRLCTVFYTSPRAPRDSHHILYLVWINHSQLTYRQAMFQLWLTQYVTFHVILIFYRFFVLAGKLWSLVDSLDLVSKHTLLKHKLKGVPCVDLIQIFK